MGRDARLGAARVGADGTPNPDPKMIRRWHIPSPYTGERCCYCDEEVAKGDLINIEFESGVLHARCYDG